MACDGPGIAQLYVTWTIAAQKMLHLPWMGNSDTYGSTGGSGFCPVARKLLEEYTAAAKASGLLHEQQFQAVVNGDTEEAERLDGLIAAANEKKSDVKFAYLQHVEEHGCSFADVTTAAKRASNANAV